MAGSGAALRWVAHGAALSGVAARHRARGRIEVRSQNALTVAARERGESTGPRPEHHRPAAAETGTVTGCLAAPRSVRFRTALGTPNLYDLPSGPSSNSRIT